MGRGGRGAGGNNHLSPNPYFIPCHPALLFVNLINSLCFKGCADYFDGVNYCPHTQLGVTRGSMPEKTFRVNVYQVELTGNEDAHQLPFHNAIEAAIGLPLAQRYREVNEKGRRLENYERRDGCFLLNFVTGQYDGPGRTSPQAAVVPIPLAPNETFAYETAMLYAPAERMVLVESSVGGMGASAVANYFEAFANPDTNYTLVP